MSDVKPDQLKALGLAVCALAPNLGSNQSVATAKVFAGFLGPTADSDSSSAVANILSCLKWNPTNAEAKQSLSAVLQALGNADDPDQLTGLIAVLRIIIPKLNVETAQETLKELKSLPNAGDPQIADTVKSINEELAALSPNLFQQMSRAHWCVPSGRSYTLALIGNSITWTDNLRNVDTEAISYATPTAARTRTQKSVHIDGRNEKIGQVWDYSLDGPDHVKVKGSSSFILSKCSR